MDATQQVRAERVIAASPRAIFDLLADPAQHREIDGSGSVREATAGSQRLALGAQFGMAMHLGLPYSMVNEVVAFDEDRCIAWQTRPTWSVLARIGGGRIWRYDLEPVAGGTRVRETWDWSEEQSPVKYVIARGAGMNRRNMAKTLARIEELVTR